jgi:hypothetical protein
MPHDKYPIDLGKSMSGELVPIKDNPREKHYPCLYLDWDGDYDLPDEGVMEVRFKKRSETNRTSDGKTTQSVEIEVREILYVEAEEGEEEESGSSALDRYRKEK